MNIFARKIYGMKLCQRNLEEGKKGSEWYEVMIDDLGICKNFFIRIVDGQYVKQNIIKFIWKNILMIYI